MINAADGYPLGVTIKNTIRIPFRRMRQGLGLAVVSVMTLVTLSQAHGEVWNCHFEGQGIQKFKVEIDIKMEIRVESFTLRARPRCSLAALSGACGTGVQRHPCGLANEHLERVKYSG
jgi:hypothetical protein